MKQVGLLLLVLVLLNACGDEGKVMPSVTGTGLPEEAPSQVSYNTEMKFTNEGKMRALLHAGRIRNYETRRYILLDSSVRVDFFDREGKHSSVLRARRARINDLSKNMTAYDSVLIVSDSGTTVITDSLEWLNATQMVRSDAFVTIKEKNGRTTSGHGFQSDQSLTNYSIARPTITAPPGVLNGGSTGPSSRPSGPAVPGPSAPGMQAPWIVTQPAAPTERPHADTQQHQ